MALTRSPLFEEHIRLSAKIAEFAGWEMPISYPSGTLEEHRVCRSGCVMFDVSHLGAVSVKGKDAYSELQYIFTNDLSRISQGKAQYSHLLNEEGHVIDDVIIWGHTKAPAKERDQKPNTTKKCEKVNIGVQFKKFCVSSS